MTFQQKVAQWIAYSLPRSICYWVLIRCGTRMMGPTEEVPAVPFTVVLQRYGNLLREKQR